MHMRSVSFLQSLHRSCTLFYLLWRLLLRTALYTPPSAALYSLKIELLWISTLLVFYTIQAESWIRMTAVEPE